MTADEILNYCLKELPGTVLVSSWGERGIFYNPNKKLKRGVYILTVKEKDGDNDASSNLDRPDVFRVNLGLRKRTFIEMFGAIPNRPGKGETVNMPYDFTSSDCVLPHPVYAWMAWICSINPSEKTFNVLKPLIRESYDFAKEKYEKKKL